MDEPIGEKRSRPEGSAKPAGAEPPNSEARTMAMLAHLLGVLTGFLGPLLIWLIKKDEHEFVDDQAKEALNFQIMLLIAFAVIGGATVVLCLAAPLLPALYVANLVFCIMGAMAANQGQRYRYPVNLRLIK